VPEAKASPSESSVPRGNGGGTGNTQTAPPCVETDGPPSKGEGLHISAESYEKHLQNRGIPDTSGVDGPLDITKRLEGVPDRLAKEALDEIIRLRSEVTSLQSGVQFWCNEVHRLCSK